MRREFVGGKKSSRDGVRKIHGMAGCGGMWRDGIGDEMADRDGAEREYYHPNASEF